MVPFGFFWTPYTRPMMRPKSHSELKLMPGNSNSVVLPAGTVMERSPLLSVGIADPGAHSMKA